jgi:predicted nucleic acid-binding protein
MPKRLLDTNILIQHFNSFPAEREKTEGALRNWGEELVEIHSTKSICSPVIVEMLAGTRNPRDLELHRAYLSAFEVIDQRNIPSTDWQNAERFASRITDGKGQSSKARDLGDCLIRAIAERLHCDIVTGDRILRKTR